MKRSLWHPLTALPERHTTVDLDWAGLSRPAEEPTGDYFQHVKLHNRGMAFAVGESGNGMNPSLATACIKGCIRAALRNGRIDPAAVVDDLNQMLYDLYPCEAFVTLFYGQYEPARCVFRYVNAGHEHPVLFQRSNGRVLRLESCAAPLGLRQSSRYRESVVRLEPGDRLIAFTPGVIDGLAERDNRGSDTALREILEECSDWNSWDTAESILEHSAGEDYAASDRTVFVASPVEKQTEIMPAIEAQEVCAFA